MSSTIIIRLQNLPLSAKAADIREFFSGLKIPEGQVNIVGGPEGDAFIGFASDEDARR
jgi:RNA recognition motif-containing protein